MDRESVLVNSIQCMLVCIIPVLNVGDLGTGPGEVGVVPGGMVCMATGSLRSHNTTDPSSCVREGGGREGGRREGGREGDRGKEGGLNPLSHKQQMLVS